jgi:hypothetical protein
MQSNSKSQEGGFTDQKLKTISSPKASFAKLTLEDEGDAFRFHFKCKATTNRTKAISQTKNQKPLAHQSQLH